MEFRYPASVYPIRDDKLSGLVIDFDDEILSEVFERDLGTESRSVVPDLVCPLLKLSIMGNTPLQGDWFVSGSARGFATRTRVTALSVLDNLGRPY